VNKLDTVNANYLKILKRHRWPHVARGSDVWDPCRTKKPGWRFASTAADDAILDAILTSNCHGSAIGRLTAFLFGHKRVWAHHKASLNPKLLKKTCNVI